LRLQNSLEINYANEKNAIEDFIKKTVSETGCKGVVLGVSGGIDSSLAATLSANALSNKRVLGIFMHSSSTPEEDRTDALNLAQRLKIETCEVDIDPLIERFVDSMPERSDDRLVIGNLKARTRMIVNYYFANKLNYLAVGTGDRSEYLIGYFTKYGDGAGDLFPIVHLYKTQVKKLSAYLGLDDSLVSKPSSPRLWKGQKATDEIPIDYPILDLILHGILDLKISKNEVAEQLNVPIKIVDDVLRRVSISDHKRKPACTIADSLRTSLG
jgi:NAD+ synthase